MTEPETRQVVDTTRMGTRGHARYPQLIGKQPPSMTEPVEQPAPGWAAPPDMPPVSPETIRATALDAFRAAIQDRLDATAREHGYDSGLTLASYVASTIPQWAADAAAYIAWRDAVWTLALAELTKVEPSGEQHPLAEFLTGLPQIEWPAL